MKRIFLTIVLVLSLWQTAQAFSVSYNFSGTITEIEDRFPEGKPEALAAITVGDPFSGTLHYGYTSHPSDVFGNQTDYGLFSVGGDFYVHYSITIRDVVVFNSPEFNTAVLATAPNALSVIDEVPDWNVDCFMEFAFFGFNGTVDPAMAITNFDSGGIGLLAMDFGAIQEEEIMGAIENFSIAAVPEPSAILLIAVGLAALSRKRYRVVN
jgi:hypothetical protein